MKPKDPAELRCRILNAADNAKLALDYLRRGSYRTGIALVEVAEAELRRLGLAVDPAQWDAHPASAGTFIDAGGDGDDTLELAGAAIDARLAESADEGPFVLAGWRGLGLATYFIRVATDDNPVTSLRAELARVWPSRAALAEWIRDQPGHVQSRLKALGLEPTPKPVADDAAMREADEAIRLPIRPRPTPSPVPTLSQSQVMYGTGERWPSRWR